MIEEDVVGILDYITASKKLSIEEVNVFDKVRIDK